ncbi:MAG: hypothetical protein ACRCZS_02385 [Chroococcidiopsis sp.]
MRLIATISLAIANLLDPYAHLKQMAADKNYLLTGEGGHWMVLTADGEVVATSSTPVDAIGQLVSH